MSPLLARISHLTENSWCPILSRDDIEKNYQTLDHPEGKLITAYLSESAGYGIIANCDIPKGTILCTYAGIIYNTKQVAEDDDYCTTVILPYDNVTSFSANMVQYSAGISSAIQGNLSRFFQHLPKSDPDYPEIIATENLTIVEAFDKQKELPIAYAITTQDIKAGEPLGFDYGSEYWKRKGVTPEYFTLDGKILPLQLFKKELGNNFFRKNMYHEALQCYIDAAQIDRTLKEAWLNAARCCDKLEAQDNALMS